MINYLLDKVDRLVRISHRFIVLLKISAGDYSLQATGNKQKAHANDKNAKHLFKFHQ
jgi:hypothetical protein